MECSNMQSGLTTSKLQISADLRLVSSLPQNIRFVQLYNDLPHRYPKTRVHPVSASVIMMEGLNTEVAQNNLYRDASSYLSEIQNNFCQIRRAKCRLEFVLNIGKRAGTISGSDFLRVDHLGKLLDTRAMIVPFLKHASTLKLLRGVGLHLFQRLDLAFRSGRGTGNTRLTWDAFQIELAVERLLWGRPLCSISNQLSKNLGPGLQYPTRCLTDQKGFLCLEDSGSCCVDDKTLPPLNLFSKNDTVQKQIQRISGVYNLIGGSQWVLGRRLIEILLNDCHSTGKVFIQFPQYLLLLKTQTGPANKNVVGGISVSDLAKMLSTGKFKWTFAFGAVKKLLLRMHLKVEEVIECGINGLSLGYFPALRGHDQNRNAGITWEYKYGFWVLTDIPDKESETERETAALQGLVLSELEKRHLCHSSQYSGIVFPWMKAVLQKILEKKLIVEDKVKVLTFISCVAFVQEGRYVDFYSLKKLERDLPVNQYTLKTLQILSPFQLPSVNTVKIFRLHSSVPLKLEMAKPENCNLSRPQEQSEEVAEPSMHDPGMDVIQPEENQVAAGTVTEDMLVHPLPSHKCYAKWSAAELDILDRLKNDGSKSLAQKYKHYQRECQNAHIPDRSFAAFRLKLRRLAIAM